MEERPDAKVEIQKVFFMIHVLATVELQPGTRADFLKEFHGIVDTVRDEDGCLEYGPAVDAATDISQQELRGEDGVTIIEKWRDVDALKSHLAAPHMTSYRERVKPYVKNVRLHVLEPA